jgi:Glucodextranase, domain B/IPT/TIG domain/Carboxypeptidase regulatory-like domain/FG-GAP repeat/Fibronectin type III domain
MFRSILTTVFLLALILPNAVHAQTAPPPEVSSLFPTFGPMGSAVTISGSNFGATQGTSTVTFNGTAAMPSSWDSTTIVVPVPSGAATGPVVVTVGGQASNGVTFTVGDSYHLHAEASSTEGLMQLKMDGPDAAATSMSAVMTGKTGEQLIQAFDTPLGNAGTVPAGATFRATLWMRKDTTNGTMTPRAKLYLNSPMGTPLCTATTTTTLAVSTSTPTEYVLTCTTTASVPITATDRLYLWVGVNITTGSGHKAVSAYAHLEGAFNGDFDSFVVGPLPSGTGPKITSLSPASGPIGTLVTISGAGFGATQGTSTVAFNGVSATPSAWSDTSITVPVPAGAATGPVTVTVSGIISNQVTFAVVSPPTNLNSIPGEGYIYMRWGAPLGSDPSTTYNVYRRTPTSSYTLLSGGITGKTYQDTTPQPGVIYRYVVTAVDASGHESVYSTETRELQTTPTILKTYDVANLVASATGDLNGDGLIDFSFGHLNSRNKPVVDVFLGGNTSSRSDYTLAVAGGSLYGLATVDLNQDGFDELIIGEPDYSVKVGTDTFRVGKVSVYSGGFQFSTSPVFTMTGAPQLEGCFANGTAGLLGYSVASAGDINGDGYPDAVVSAPRVNECSGKVIFIMGGPNLSNPVTSEWGGPLQYGFAGNSVSAAGDVNGDGYADVLVGAPAPTGFTGVSVGKTYLLAGGSSVQLAATFETGIVNDHFGDWVASAGDVNGDGFPDMAVISRLGVHIYFGGALIDSTQDMFVEENAYFNGTDAISGAIVVFPGGRLNGDSIDDLVIDYGITAYFGDSDTENYADIRNGGANNERRVLGVIDYNGDGIKEVITTDSASPPSSVRIESLLPYLTLPEIRILSPLNYITTLNQTVPLQGTVSGAILNLTVRGQPVVVSNGAFQTDLLLAEGGNVIEIIAETPDGRLVKRTLDITFAVPPPLLINITNPADGAVLNSTPITVSGTISDSTANVVVQGVNAIVTGNTFAAAGIPLVEGSNTITATATDSFGQMATASVTVTLLTKGTVTGTVTDAATSLPLPGVDVTIQNTADPVTTVTDANGVYSATVTQGSITVTFSRSGYISQSVGNTVTAGQTLTLDSILTPIPPLTLSITSPQDGVVLNSTPLTVSGQVSNNAQVTVNGVAASVSGNTYSASVPLSEGPNTIIATATDSYDQTATASITVTLTGSNVLTGTVTDASTGLPILLSASVSVTDSIGHTETALTDSDGAYQITNLAEGNFTGTITKTGYVPYSLSGVIGAGQTVLNAALSPTSPGYANLTVTNITTDSATIHWTTNQLTNSLVSYGPTPAYGSSVSDSAYVTAHNISLVGLTSNTIYHFKVTSVMSGGTSISSSDLTFQTLAPINLTITSPLDSEEIGKTETLVHGTISGGSGLDMGVTVNGILGNIYGGEFVANHVPLTAGANTLTVTATDVSGATATASVTVQSVPAAEYITLRANPESGVAPLQTTVTIDSTFAIASSTLSSSGPGTAVITGISQSEYQVNLTVEGTYYLTASVTDGQGGVYTDTIAITALNLTQLDALLQAKWNSMTAALLNNDVQSALRFFTSGSVELYSQNFTIMSSILPQIASDLGTIQFVRSVDNGAVYEMDLSQGGQVTSFYVLFVLDEDGIWKIKFF